MSTLEFSLLIYVVITVALALAFVYIEYRSPGSEYDMAIAFAVCWFFVLVFALLMQYVNWRRG